MNREGSVSQLLRRLAFLVIRTLPFPALLLWLELHVGLFRDSLADQAKLGKRENPQLVHFQTNLGVVLESVESLLSPRQHALCKKRQSDREHRRVFWFLRARRELFRCATSVSLLIRKTRSGSSRRYQRSL